MSDGDSVPQPEEPPHEDFDCGTHQDTVSFYVYDKSNPKAWIRSDITIERSLDNDGYETLSPYSWKEQYQSFER
jgi:hypothetical protein